MAEAANSAPRRRQRRLELGSGEPGTPGPDEDADDSRAGSWRARRQLLPPMGEADAGAARPPAIAAADGAADADGADLGLRADAGRSRRRRQADGAAESAAASAGGAVRKALERISPRRRPAEETELLQLMPDKEDVLSQRGGGALGEADASQPFGGLHGGGEAGRAAAATWVEDAATGAFRRAAEPGSGAGRGRGSLGLARAGERGPTERMAVLAERARALLSAALGLCEGVLAGMCGLHALVAEECARRPFLVAGYLRAARATHQAFHLLCTMALLSALVAMGSAGLSLERLERADQGWERAAAYREAGRQQAAAALAALLYAAALVCSLLATETVWRWSLVDTELISRLSSNELDAFAAEAFDGAYPLWRGLSLARTALCMVAWGLTSASSVSRHAVGPAAEPGSLAATPKEGQAQPSLVGTLLARSL